jgi:uncharacterized membrane protein YdcZ (DUF606 family)
MAWMFALAWLAGVAGVLQGGITKKLGERVGMASVLHVSNLVVLVGGVIVLTLIASRGHGDFTKLLRTKADFRAWSPWVLLPGVFGLFFIAVTPFAISRIGALHVFVAVVFGQIIGSAVWDWLIEGQPLDRYRLIGAGLTLAGAYAISLSEPAT